MKMNWCETLSAAVRAIHAHLKNGSAPLGRALQAESSVEMMQRLCVLPQDHGDLTTEWKHLKLARILAATYAESGDFDSAISILRSAVAVAVTPGPNEAYRLSGVAGNRQMNNAL